MNALPAEINVKYRGAQAGDINFILHSWMESYRPYRRKVHNNYYYMGQQALIAALAEKAKLLVCCDATKGSENFILGWVCGEMDVPTDTLTLHYIYVKGGYRLAGIGRDLLAQMGRLPGTKIVCTHWTQVARECRERYRLMFNDFLLMIGNQHV